jgi:hypothetical protein
MGKVITGSVILEVSKDQKREKAATLTARLIAIPDPSKVRVAAPFHAAEARVVEIDSFATQAEIRHTLAKDGRCLDWQCRYRMVDSEVRSHQTKTFAMHRVPGGTASEEDMHFQVRQGAAVLQDYRLGTPSQIMHWREPEMRALRCARGTVGTQDGRRRLLPEKGSRWNHLRIRGRKW